jgi:hypothetical protein
MSQNTQHSQSPAGPLPPISTSRVEVAGVDSRAHLKIGATTLEFSDLGNVVKIVEVSGKEADALADLMLDARGLCFALASLEALSGVDVSKHVREALWRSALVEFYKCFRNGRRSHLDSNKVYKSEPPGTLESFKHLHGVRDKHVAHDVNPYAKAAVGAAINNAGNRTKIETVFAAAFYLETLDQTQYANLRNLVQKALIGSLPNSTRRGSP